MFCRRTAPIVSDGPFLETKEVIGGYFLIECDDYAEALEIAKRCPHAPDGIGPVEIREIIPWGRRRRPLCMARFLVIPSPRAVCC